MKTQRIQNTVAVIAVAGLALLSACAMAQDATSAAPPAATVAPQMTKGAAEVLRLTQAKVSDDTIVTYIRNSGTGYSLNADQIIYLRQQGVSTDVLNAMLNQTAQPAVASAPAPAPAPAPQATEPATQPAPAAATATVAPAVTYVQTVPTTTYYYSSPYYYPASYGYYGYGWGYPAVSLSFGWGGRWGGGWGWRGGGHGGWHR